MTYKEQVIKLAQKIRNTPPKRSWPSHNGFRVIRSYATLTELYLTNESVENVDDDEDYIQVEFYYDLFEALNIFDTCSRIEIEGEFIVIPQNIAKFKSLEFLTLPYPRSQGQFDSTFLPDSLIFFDSHENDRHESKEYLEGINRCHNLQTLMINTSQIADNVLEDLSYLKVIFIKYSNWAHENNALVKQFLQKVRYRIDDENHPRHILFDSD